MRCVILANGSWGNVKLLWSALKKGDLIVACDGAYAKARKAGITPSMIVGDFDSLRLEKVPPQILTLAFPEEKDETDAELALEFALEKKPSKIIWYAAFGKRWDHTIANLFLFTKSAKAGVPMTVIQDRWLISLVLTQLELKGHTGDRLSLIPLSSVVRGITTRGLRYPLQNE